MALNINGTTGISGVDGSVSAPAVTGTDSNTGITFPSADTIKFSTGGVERISITNSGISGTGILTTGGKLLQHLTTSSSTTVSVTTETNLLTLSITPASTSNKILCLFTGIIQCVPNGSSYASIKLYRGTSSGTLLQRTIEGITANSYTLHTHNLHELDSPSTTSSQQYTITINKNSGNTASATTDGQMYRLTLMEFAA